jgi:hypothetical protein
MTTTTTAVPAYHDESNITHRVPTTSDYEDEKHRIDPEKAGSEGEDLTAFDDHDVR